MAGAEGDDAGAVLDHIVTQFGTYEEYLDSQITTQDLFYLEVSVPSLHTVPLSMD